MSLRQTGRQVNMERAIRTTIILSTDAIALPKTVAVTSSIAEWLSDDKGIISRRDNPEIEYPRDNRDEHHTTSKEPEMPLPETRRLD